jgi:hypothetical protein
MGSQRSKSSVHLHSGADEAVGAIDNTLACGDHHGMKATELRRTRIVYSEGAFAELVLWQLPSSLPGSTHAFKYRLAYVVRGVCVLRYDNEAGKGNHRHWKGQGSAYDFQGPEALILAFKNDIRRWNDENGDA